MRREEVHGDDAAAEEVIVRRPLAIASVASALLAACAGLPTQLSEPPVAGSAADEIPAEMRDDASDRFGNHSDRCAGSRSEQRNRPDGCSVPHPTRNWVTFDFDSAELRADARAVLDAITQDLGNDHDQKVHFEIVGHADACGSRAHNHEISARRVRSVERYLLGLGVDPGKIARTQGLGDTRPLERDLGDGCRSETNRRVELTSAR